MTVKDKKKEINHLTLHFGSLAVPLEKQLNAQGFTLGEKAKSYDKINSYLIHIYFFGLITPSELEKFRKKLMKKIVKEVEHA